MTKTAKSAPFMENAKNRNPIDPESRDPSLNSEILATTSINSSVSPEDYPKADRDEQVRAATGTTKRYSKPSPRH